MSGEIEEGVVKGVVKRDEQFLYCLNSHVGEIDLSPLPVPHRARKLPLFFFVIGAPRSGTTLLTQVLAYCLDLGYITNLAARFWCNPPLGIRLSLDVFGSDALPTFTSSLARTSTPQDIHEFGRFWRRVLHMRAASDIADVSFLPEDVTSELSSIYDCFGGRSVVMKGIYPAYYHRHFWQLRDRVSWVNIERDLVDTCLSIHDARLRRFGPLGLSSDVWFGWYFPADEQAKLAGLSVYEQIVRQVIYFRDYYRSIATHTISLADLCTKTEEVIARLAGDLSIIRLPCEGAFKLHSYFNRPKEYAMFAEIVERVVMDERDQERGLTREVGSVST